MSKKDELRAGLMSTFLPNLPASELEKAKNLAAGENRPDLLVGDSPTALPVVSEVAPVAEKKTKRTLEQPESRRRGTSRRAAGSIAHDVEEEIASTREPRFSQFIPHTFRLSTEQIAALAEAELLILRNGIKKKERVSNNSVLRTLVDLLIVLKVDMTGIDSESSLRRALFDRCGIKTSESSTKAPPNE